MRRTTGALLFALAASGVAIYFAVNQRQADPPPEFADLELTRGDAAATGSCFSLQSVLVANNLTGPAKRSWTSSGAGEWTLRIDNGRDWRSYRFQLQNGVVVPFQVVSSDSLPQVDTEQAVGAWIARAEARNAPLVHRCRK